MLMSYLVYRALPLKSRPQQQRRAPLGVPVESKISDEGLPRASAGDDFLSTRHPRTITKLREMSRIWKQEMKVPRPLVLAP